MEPAQAQQAQPTRQQAAADAAALSALAEQLRGVRADFAPADSERAKSYRQMVSAHTRRRLVAANQASTAAWAKVQSLEQWKTWKTERIEELKRRLNIEPSDGQPPKSIAAGTLTGEGYAVEKLVYESRPGLWVTANLYRPEPLRPSMPAILISHSHHSPKTQSELQDMGIVWSRLGCQVLVIDHLGHGERRQHPFVDAASYPKSFRVGRQDYYFRYNLGLQLPLAGESLMGWLVHDLRRGVDLLVNRPGVDAKRIAILGAVAGGGDPAAVTAAVDERIAAAAPFNFGGPQPETRYPLPEDAAATFNYAGGGSWESTRNLQHSAAGGFLPWVIVGSLAPRGLIYGHEFAWDQPRDPVWARMEKIYGMFSARDRLTSAIGRGRLSGQPPESSHCNNIGVIHRQGIYAALNQWFGVPVPERENDQRRPAEELLCLTPAVLEQIEPRRAHQLAYEQLMANHEATRTLPAAERRQRLRVEWQRSLGDVEPKAPPRVVEQQVELLDTRTVQRVWLETEPGIDVPLLLLLPPNFSMGRHPIVVGVAQQGKQALLKERAATVARLLRTGNAVCLPDLRGTGETRPGDSSRGRQSSATSLSSSEWMLGQTLLGGQLHDLRSVLAYLRSREDVFADQVALWGDSLAEANPADRTFAVPLDAEDLPKQAEPLGGLMALLGMLYDDQVQGAYVRGGLSGYLSILESPFCYVPHDCVPLGGRTSKSGDLCDLVAALAPRRVQLEGLVDGLNRRLSDEALAATYEVSQQAYRSPAQLRMKSDPSSETEVAIWLGSMAREPARKKFLENLRPK